MITLVVLILASFLLICLGAGIITASPVLLVTLGPILLDVLIIVWIVKKVKNRKKKKK